MCVCCLAGCIGPLTTSTLKLTESGLKLTISACLAKKKTGTGTAPRSTCPTTTSGSLTRTLKPVVQARAHTCILTKTSSALGASTVAVGRRKGLDFRVRVYNTLGVAAGRSLSLEVSLACGG